MFCENCGKELNQGVNFCSFCGTKVEEIVLPATNAQEMPTEEPPKTETFAVEEQATSQTVATQPVASASAQQPYVKKTVYQHYVPSNAEVAPKPVNKKSSKWPVIIAVIVTAVVVLASSSCCCFGGVFWIGTEAGKVENVAKDFAQIQLEDEYDEVEITDAYRLDEGWDEALEFMMLAYGYEEHELDDYCLVMIEATVDGEHEDFKVFCIERDGEWIAKELVP